MIERLRLRTVPSGYTLSMTLADWDKITHVFHSCLLIPLLSDGVKETMIYKLRSILAQFEYKYQVCVWDSKGVPFSTYLYVPENHPLTGKQFHEREDFAHVLKVGTKINIVDMHF